MLELRWNSFFASNMQQQWQWNENNPEKKIEKENVINKCSFNFQIKLFSSAKKCSNEGNSKLNIYKFLFLNTYIINIHCKRIHFINCWKLKWTFEFCHYPTYISNQQYYCFSQIKLKSYYVIYIEKLYVCSYDVQNKLTSQYIIWDM